jgi:ComF family protein
MSGQYIEPMELDASHGIRRLPGDGAGSRWPRQCEICRQWSRSALCAACLQRHAAPRPRCPRCAIATPAAQVCGECLRAPPPFERCLAAVDYGFPWDHLLSAFKFNDRPELAAALVDLIERALDRAAPWRADLLLPVPLSEARLRERGYNQAWELARRLAARRGLASRSRWLGRLRDTPHQVGLSRQERQRNLRDAIWVDPGAADRLAGRHVALVDDVLTTGVTAAAASQALLRAGAASVVCWVVARTPAPET